jgi:hypothetical protein
MCRYTVENLDEASWMFTYGQGPAWQRLLDSGIEGAEIDDWLEGWNVGTVQMLLDKRRPRRALDIELGNNLRLYRKAVVSAGCKITLCSIDRLGTVSDSFDLVLALSFQRGECLSAIDPGDAYR